MVQCHPFIILIPLCILSLSEGGPVLTVDNHPLRILCFYDMNLLYCVCFIFEHQDKCASKLCTQIICHDLLFFFFLSLRQILERGV